MTDPRLPTEHLIPVDILAERISGKLRIEWSDGHVSIYAFEYLRGHCPCTPCRRRNGERAHEETGKGVALASLTVVDNRAICIAFEDDHEGCDYSFELLRRICPCGQRH